MKNALAIIAPTINPSVLPDFVRSVKEQESKNYHAFIIDVSDSKEEFFVGENRISYLKRENKGYAYSVNEGIKEALEKDFSKFCIINDDTYFEKNFVTKVLAALEQHPQSIIGGKVYYASGYEYHKERYREENLGKVIWYAGGFFDWDHALSIHRGVDEIDHGQYDNLEETEFITGALIFFDKSAFDRVGFWDESFFLYFEDADYCVRAEKNGISLYYDPSVMIWHKVSQSTGGSGSELHARYQRKNRLKFGLRYAPLNTKLHLLKNFFFGNVANK